MIKSSKKGFTLIEAILVVVVVAITFLGFGYLFGNLDQKALESDLTVLATKLAKEKMEEVLQQKADAGYAAISSQASAPVTSGTWSFNRSVVVTYVDPSNFSSTGTDTGYKKIDVAVSWGAGAGKSITLTSLVTNMVPSAVAGAGYAQCP